MSTVKEIVSDPEFSKFSTNDQVEILRKLKGDEVANDYLLSMLPAEKPLPTHADIAKAPPPKEPVQPMTPEERPQEVLNVNPRAAAENALAFGSGLLGGDVLLGGGGTIRLLPTAGAVAKESLKTMLPVARSVARGAVGSALGTAAGGAAGHTLGSGLEYVGAPESTSDVLGAVGGFVGGLYGGYKGAQGIGVRQLAEAYGKGGLQEVVKTLLARKEAGKLAAKASALNAQELEAYLEKIDNPLVRVLTKQALQNPNVRWVKVK